MKTKAVISVTGKDNVGIIAKVSNVCSEYGANIIDVSQTVLKEYFAMIMLVEIDSLTLPFTEFVDRVAVIGKELGLEIHAMHEDIFDSMHKI
ncbi:MAG: ACT domain-containing protein [Clostridia bacterium]|nr:ACT domain-containing protein [Clostridia bacterium]